jgi:hypothetical protein
MDWPDCPAVHGVEPRNFATLKSAPSFVHAGRQYRQPRQRRGSNRRRGLETGRVETGTQLVFLIHRLLRRPTFAAQRLPESQIFGLLVLPPFAPRAVEKLGQAPSRPPIFQGFRGSHSEPVPFFRSLSRKAGFWRCTSESARRRRSPSACETREDQPPTGSGRGTPNLHASLLLLLACWEPTKNLRPVKTSGVPISNSPRFEPGGRRAEEKNYGLSQSTTWRPGMLA